MRLRTANKHRRRARFNAHFRRLGVWVSTGFFLYRGVSYPRKAVTPRRAGSGNAQTKEIGQ